MIFIGILIGLFIGTFLGIVLTALMTASKRDDNLRAYTDLKEELDKIYRCYNDHLLAISPDETTPDSEYQFRKGMAVGIQQCLNGLGEITK